MEERRPLDGRFMSRLTRLRLLSRRWQHHAFTTPSGREKEGEGRGLHLSRCHIALMQDLDRSRGWSTISWLNRLINGSRGGSRPICITLAPPSSLEPVQRHRINPLRLFLRGTIYLSYGERCSLSAWEWSLSLVALIIILGTICFISPSFPRDVIIVRLVLIIFQCSNRGIVYSSFYTSLLCIRYQFIKLYRKLNLCLKILFTRAWELFEKYIVLRKYIYISIIDIVIYTYVNFGNISVTNFKKKIFQTNILNHFQNNLEISPHG